MTQSVDGLFVNIFLQIVAFLLFILSHISGISYSLSYSFYSLFLFFFFLVVLIMIQSSTIPGVISGHLYYQFFNYLHAFVKLCS